MSLEVEHIGPCTLYRADCREVLPTLPSVSLVCADPPYGIKQDKGFGGFVGFGGFGAPIPRKRYLDTWDAVRPSKECFDMLLTWGNQCIIWGGNFFTDLLPVNGHWLVWDKLQTMPSFGDCELAWTNIPRKSVKKITLEYNGLLGKEPQRFHPTQKPVSLMHWVVRTYTTTQMIVGDPFMGSGTTGVACVQLGRAFIGIEMEDCYFQIACQRLSEAVKQPDLFVPIPSPPKQVALFGGTTP